MTRHPAPRPRRGSALSISIVLSVVLTALVSALACVAAEQSRRTAQLAQLDQAFFAAESGAQVLAWYSRNSLLSQIPAGFTGKSIAGFNVTATWSNGAGTSINIASAASNASASSPASYALTANITPPSAGLPTFASGSNFDNQNITIIGNVEVGGDYTNAGHGSLTGNLTYAGNAMNTSAVTGTKTHGPITPISFPTLDATLTAHKTDRSPTQTFDFTALPDDPLHPKVIYVNGEVQNPVIIGSGTLYINGNLLINNPNVTLGSADNPVNLVVNGDINFSKKVALYGGLYGKQNLNRAQLDITGCLYVAGIANSNNGQCTWTFTSAPWFDPRANGTSGKPAPLTIASFAGPQP